MTHEEERRRIGRLRTWVLVLTVVVLAGAIAAPVIGNSIAERNADRVQLQATREHARTQAELTCTTLEAQHSILVGLEQVRNELGLPGDLMIPEVPPQCDGS